MNDYPLGFAYDVLQTAAEQFGMTDDTSAFLADYVNNRMTANSSLNMILVAHSQGGAKLKQAFDWINHAVRDRVYIITAAGAQIGGFPRAKEANLVNRNGDLVCAPIGNDSWRGNLLRWVLGEDKNEVFTQLPYHGFWDKVPILGLANHPYVENYNADVARIIREIAAK